MRHAFEDALVEFSKSNDSLPGVAGVVYRLLRSPVAKHARRFNKAHVHRDRKKDAKRGYRKHKGTLNE